MSSLAIAPRHYPDDWITPQEQMQRLVVELAKQREIDQAWIEKLSKPTNADRVTALAVNAVLKRSEGAPLASFPEYLVNWYIARERLKILPEKLPPLPYNIVQILQDKCPIYGEYKKPDGTDYGVNGTHVLQLLCEEDENLRQFGEAIKPYNNQHGWARGKCIQLHIPESDFPESDFQTQINARFEPTHWDLLTKDLLPGSRHESYSDQINRVASLSRKAFANYEIPSLKNIFRTSSLHQVATGEQLYTTGTKEDGHTYLSTQTHVQESNENGHLIFGTKVNLHHSFNYWFIQDGTGVGARRKFPSPIIPSSFERLANPQREAPSRNFRFFSCSSSQ